MKYQLLHILPNPQELSKMTSTAHFHTLRFENNFQDDRKLMRKFSFSWSLLPLEQLFLNMSGYSCIKNEQNSVQCLNLRICKKLLVFRRGLRGISRRKQIQIPHHTPLSSEFLVCLGFGLLVSWLVCLHFHWSSPDTSCPDQISVSRRIVDDSFLPGYPPNTKFSRNLAL